MDEKVIKKIDSAIAELCVLMSDRAKHANTDKVIALAEAFGKILTARASIFDNVHVEADEIALQLADGLEKSLQSIERIEKFISNEEESTRQWCSVKEKERHKVPGDKS